MFTIQFLGAAGQVTGSKYFLRTATHRGALVDCGLFQGPRALRQMNWNPMPVDIGEIANVIVTHAHLDHTGYLPRLVKSGFGGRIWMTPATYDVGGFILRDSAHLQEEDAEHANKHHWTRHKPALPLYTSEDAERVLGLCNVHDRNDTKVLEDDLSFRYTNAGHILGSCSIKIEKRFIDNRGTAEREPVSIFFSGDIGRKSPIYLIPKDPPEAADYIVCESTYGDKLHHDVSPMEEIAVIVEEIVRNKSVLLIPAFAVDRVQEIIYCLNALIRDGRLPAIPTYVDSPMATSVTALYEKYTEEHIMRAEELEEQDKNPLAFPSLHFVQTVDESKGLNKLQGPAIIISASGMATGGRIVHHLEQRLGDTNTTVLFTGYQAEETLGRDLLQGAQIVSLFGKSVDVKARILQLTNFSAHADQAEILDWLRQVPKPPKKLFLTHGEDGPRAALKQVIERELGWNVYLPKLGETVDLLA